MRGGTILFVRRANEAINTCYVVVIILLGVALMLILRWCDVQRVLIGISFGWFVLGTFHLLGYRGERL